ncbi:Ribosomal large subunit pseudouridine synthase B [Candidatus Ornithobacterium hominis]|uniref:pseudouridine synthase n=1 Tax=Candidatus Ornithobacterium hominis TaxID=2497989 RepID=UPI000E5B01A4|nr:pseudouridine synthase [Candidatus Ornithobacterium hominis]SZD71490.1 Ribosomal large subunit pseudouridine synthase B [Candidatus Ornithobacterium hominis]
MRRKSDDNRNKRTQKNFGGNKNRKPNFSKKFNKPKPQKADKKPNDDLMRLNKFIANAGVCSRREADELIKTGAVEVNGMMITEMGYKVKPDDEVRYDGELLTPEKKVYVLLNKPKNFITTTSDERDRKTVMDLIANATSARIFPVGRLDRQTTGVLLFTNDGDLTKKLTHPSHQVRKIYHVVLDKSLHGEDLQKIMDGIRMEEGVAKVDKISFIEGKAHNEVGVEIHIGWNRVVRRIFEKLGYKIEHLDRVSFAGLTKKNLKRGDWRILERDEINFLKMM